jgi:hypothetical protein
VVILPVAQARRPERRYMLDALDSLPDVEQVECGFNGFANAMFNDAAGR